MSNLLTPAQLATLQSELNEDPAAVGYAPYLAVQNFQAVADLLNWERDGQTPCPDNNVIGNITSSITDATNTNPIVITSANHGLAAGEVVSIFGVGGNTAANGEYAVTVLTANTFSIPVAGNAAYTSGGVWVPANTRNTSISSASILGALAPGDLITANLTTAVTANQFGVFQMFVAMVNQPSGSVPLTNADGSDNNISKNLKKVCTNPSTSLNNLVALEFRPGSRAEVLLGLSGIVLGQIDAQAAYIGHYNS
jgi:hypothetical protein